MYSIIFFWGGAKKLDAGGQKQSLKFCVAKMSTFDLWCTLTFYPWTKFVVPSTGSMIHVGLSVKMHGSPFATDSSPMKLQAKQKVTIFEKFFSNKYIIYLLLYIGKPTRCLTSAFLYQTPPAAPQWWFSPPFRQSLSPGPRQSFWYRPLYRTRRPAWWPAGAVWLDFRAGRKKKTGSMEGGNEPSSGTSPARRATLIAQSYALCHGSSILLLDKS